MNCFVFKFKNRNPDDISNKCLAEIYVKGPKFDIDLIATDQKVISAHKYVVSMFSDYLKDYIREFSPKGKACISLSEVSSFILKQVIDLFYNGQIMVGAEVEPHIVKALIFLKIANVGIPVPNNVSPLMLSQTRPKPQMPTQQMNNHAAKMNQPQYPSPAKRQRTQSMYVEFPAKENRMNSTFSQVTGLPSHIGESIAKAKAAPAPAQTAMALLQNTQLRISRVQKPIQQQNIAK